MTNERQAESLQDCSDTGRKAFYDLILACGNFGAAHLKNLDEAALATIGTSIEDGTGRFITQVEMAADEMSRVTVLLKVIDEHDEHRLYPLCCLEESLQTIN